MGASVTTGPIGTSGASFPPGIGGEGFGGASSRDADDSNCADKVNGNARGMPNVT